MGAIEIITIIVAVGIVLGVVIASIVRKLKGKPSIGCDCAGCAHAKECSGNCSCSQEGSADWKELVEKRKQELENQASESDTCECCKHSTTSAMDNNNQ